jgi:hypothetical protein
MHSSQILINVTHIGLRSKTLVPGSEHGLYQWRYLNNVVIGAGLGFSSAFECRPIVSLPTGDLCTSSAVGPLKPVHANAATLCREKRRAISLSMCESQYRSGQLLPVPSAVRLIAFAGQHSTTLVIHTKQLPSA